MKEKIYVEIGGIRLGIVTEEGESYAKEIAAALGKNEKAVSNAIGRIRKKLKAARADFDF